MGAHKTYGQFRGAKEILEILGFDPEEGAEADTTKMLKALVWTGQPVQGESSHHESSSVTRLPEPAAEVQVLQAEMRALNAKMEAKMDAQAATLEALKAQNALLLAKLEEGKEVKTKRAGGKEGKKKHSGRKVSSSPVELHELELKPEAKRKVFKMPSIDRNPESLNENYTASGRLKHAFLPDGKTCLPPQYRPQ
jgi:hypothetical protein